MKTLVIILTVISRLSLSLLIILGLQRIVEHGYICHVWEWILVVFGVSTVILTLLVFSVTIEEDENTEYNDEQ